MPLLPFPSLALIRVPRRNASSPIWASISARYSSSSSLASMAKNRVKPSERKPAAWVSAMSRSRRNMSTYICSSCRVRCTMVSGESRNSQPRIFFSPAIAATATS